MRLKHVLTINEATPTNETIIMYQLKPFKQYLYYRNKQLDNNNNVFSITSRIGKVYIKTQNLLSDPDSCFI